MKLKRIMIILLSILLVLVIGVIIFMQTPRFGKNPTTCERVLNSPNYQNGEFKNLSPTPTFSEGSNFLSVLKEFFTTNVNEPNCPLPSKKTNLNNLRPDKDILIWMGHSSYFMQLNGKTILVDPVLSGNASPVDFTTKAFKGSDIYTYDDIPEIDYLLITHDHYDHLDYETIKALQQRINKIVCGLGIGSHLEYWGFKRSQIITGDWYDTVSLNDDIIIHITPSRHFSGRGIKRNQTLWSSYALCTPKLKIFIGGDGGYGDHFAKIGEKYGPFDLAVLENGQYNPNWEHIHMLPGEQLKAAQDLKAEALLPVHSAKFTLANHDWDEPLNKITELPNDTNIRIITPMIGEKVKLYDKNQQFKKWWKELEFCAILK